MGRRTLSGLLCPCSGPSSAQVMPSSRAASGGGAAPAAAAATSRGLDYLNNVSPSTMEELAAEAEAARQEKPNTLTIPGTAVRRDFLLRAKMGRRERDSSFFVVHSSLPRSFWKAKWFLNGGGREVVSVGLREFGLSLTFTAEDKKTLLSFSFTTLLLS